MRSFLAPTLIAAAALTLSGTPAWGAGVAGVKVDPSPAKAQSEVKIVISGDADAPNFCGLRVEFGDGRGIDVKIDDKSGLWPRTLTHAYAKAGTYTVTVTGKRVTTHLPCGGDAKATVTVEGTAPKAEAKPAGEAKAAAPSSGAACPEGYKMVGKKDKAGAFKCTKAAKDAKLTEIDCGEKLEFYAQGKTIGCRKPAAKK